jgi:hypothetical protein
MYMMKMKYFVILDYNLKLSVVSDDDDDTELGLCSTPHTDAQHENVSNGKVL